MSSLPIAVVMVSDNISWISSEFGLSVNNCPQQDTQVTQLNYYIDYSRQKVLFYRRIVWI